MLALVIRSNARSYAISHLRDEVPRVSCAICGTFGWADRNRLDLGRENGVLEEIERRKNNTDTENDDV